MSVLAGDFIGFSFNGVHSSDLGIIRTSNGSRFDENLLPTIQNNTVQVPGGNGTYYFGSSHTQKPFSIPIAFDGLTESGVRRLREVFGTDKICRLIYDETPYKYYMVKISAPPQIKTICFDETGERIYKGEGTLQFVAYYPYAKSVHKYLNEFNDENKDEWAEASRMLVTKGTFDTNDSASIKIYNAGDLETEFLAYYLIPDTGISSLKSVNIDNFVGLNFKTINKQGSDKYFRINSKTNLIEGGNLTIAGNYTTFVPSGYLYNKYISSGDFFKIQTMEKGTSMQFKSTGANCLFLDYSYVYY